MLLRQLGNDLKRQKETCQFYSYNKIFDFVGVPLYTYSMKFNHYFRSSQEFSLKVTKLISVKTEVEQRSNCYLKAKASFLTLRSKVKKKGWGHLYKRKNCFTYNCLLRCTVFFWIDYMIHNLNLWKMLWENNSLPTCDTAVRVSALYTVLNGQCYVNYWYILL